MKTQQIFTLTPELDIAIEDFFHTHRCQSRSDAVRKMVAIAAGIEIPTMRPGGRQPLYGLKEVPAERPQWAGNPPLNARSLGVTWKLVPFLGTCALWTESEILREYWAKQMQLPTDAKTIGLGMAALGWKKTRMVQNGEAVTVYLAPVEGIEEGPR